MKRALAGVFALALTAVAAGTVASGARAQTNQPQQSPPSQTPAQARTSQCTSEGGTPIQLQSVMALHGDGSKAPARDNDGQGRVYTFPDGGYTVQPPPGFNPLTASDQELATYLFEPRPTDPAQMDHWRSLYASYRHGSNNSDSDPTMCKTNQHANWYVGTDKHWSGAVNNAAPPEGYWTAQVGFSQTGFDNLPGCAGLQSSYITWAGLGGAQGSKKLVQAGTDTGTSDINELHDFYEMIDSAGDDTGAVWYSNFGPHPGDTIYASVKNVQNDHLEYLVIDKTNGHNYNDPIVEGKQGYFDGISLTQFIDATTAEYITENSQGPNPFLRKPHLGNTWMFWEQADQAGMQNFGRYGLDEITPVRYMQRISTVANDPNPTWNGLPSFYDDWVNCW